MQFITGNCFISLQRFRLEAALSVNYVRNGSNPEAETSFIPSSLLLTGSDCSRNFTSHSGLIESPGFPDKYPHNLECFFIIVVPPSMDVTLSFLTFDLENDPLPGGEGECKYDWLEVWDGLPGGTAPATHVTVGFAAAHIAFLSGLDGMGGLVNTFSLNTSLL